MTVYIDSLFMTNLFMDSIIIFITSVMRRKQITALRLFIGALVSALYGTLIFFPEVSFMYSAALKIVFSAVPVLIAMGGRGVKDFLISWTMFWFITVAAGGTVFAVSTLTDFGSIMQTMISNCVMYVQISPFILLGGCIVLYLLAEIYRRACIKNFTSDKFIINLTALYMGNSFKITGLVDTGCELTEPLSGAPVIVAERKCFRGIPESGALIEINTASGIGSLELLFPEKITCESSNVDIEYDTVIALTDSRLSEYNVYNAVINPAALNLAAVKINKELATGCLK